MNPNASESPQSTLARWKAEEAAIRARLAPAGKIALQDLAASSGLEFLQRIGRGELPSVPIGETLDFVPIEAERGRMVFQGTPKPQFYNPLGSVHGGYAATLLDSCVACAVHSTLEQGQGYTTIELKVNFVRPLTDDIGPVRAEGKVVSVTRQIGVAEGRITDAHGKLYAYATTTCLIFPIKAAA